MTDLTARTEAAIPTQKQMNEAFYVDVCRAEDRLKEFITASLALLDSLPDHWHREEENELRSLCEETAAVLSPHMHPPKFVEIATKRYGGASHTTLARQIAEGIGADVGAVPDGWQLVPKEPTETMLWAGEGVSDFILPEAVMENTRPNRMKHMADAYAEMLSAAPQPPAASVESTPGLKPGWLGEVCERAEARVKHWEEQGVGWEKYEHATFEPTQPAGDSVELADWSVLPSDLYVIGVRKHDIGYDVSMCSVPMITAPEVRYVRADRIEALTAERDTQTRLAGKYFAETCRLTAENARLRLELANERGDCMGHASGGNQPSDLPNVPDVLSQSSNEGRES